MTRRRVVALAQALTMIMLLMPGLDPAGPSPVRAAPAPPGPDATTALDASGTGVGCRAGTTRYRGPRLPKNPPWPPGAKPSPTPEADPAAPPQASSSAGPDGTQDAAATVATALVAADGVTVAQAGASDGSAEEAVPDVTPEPAPRRRKSDLMRGVDVSKWQDAVDYDVIRDAGNRFVIMKATESTEFVDSWFPTNYAAARAAGLTVGAYHVFDYNSDGTAQADHFVNRLEAIGGLEGALPPAVDVECFKYRGRSVHAIAATRLRDLVGRIYERTGRLPLLYTSAYMWHQVVGNAEGFEDLPLWAACWGCDEPPSIASGWDDWTFWQIGTFRINGAAPSAISPNRIDGNYFSGDEADLEALTLRPFQLAGGAAVTGAGSVELDLGGRAASAYRTSLDGQTWGAWERLGAVPTASLPAEQGVHTVHAQFRGGPGLRSPVVSDSIFVDLTAPEATTPVVSLREGPLDPDAAAVPVAVRWQAQDEHAGLGDGAVTVACGDAPVRRDAAPGSAAPGELSDWTAATQVLGDADCTVTAIAVDAAGNRAPAAASDVSTRILPAADRAALSGDQFGIIARRGPDGGRASVSVDGQAVGLFDLYAPEPTGPLLVYVADLPGDVNSEVVIEGTGTSDPAATGSSVVIEGFVSLASAR